MTNCPNCGAPITGYRCEYCDTVFNISKGILLLEENELLLAKTKHLHDVTTMQDLYESALQAMRRYAITPNEARKLVGLDETKKRIVVGILNRNYADLLRLNGRR